MKGRIFIIFALCLCLASAGYGASNKQPKKRFFVVSSFHREYPWSKDTNRGFCAAMLAYGYFDNRAQIEEYTGKDYVETSKAVFKKVWMDAKRKSGKQELIESTIEITRTVKAFNPDILFLGDDEAGNYIGNQFLDAGLPVVFWGFNVNPVKYGLVETADRPGHNVTGVYRSGYYTESLRLLKEIAPGVKTFAILSDESPAGRAHRKELEYLARKGVLPLKFTESVATSDFDVWKSKALELQKKADAFFVAVYSTLRDERGEVVPDSSLVHWYLQNIKVPEAAPGSLVKQGLLCAADDSGYNQGFEAGSIARDILKKGTSPAITATRTPKRGALMVNRRRAETLGIALTGRMGIEEYVDGTTQ